MTKKWVNGTVRDLTTEEQAEYDARNKAWNDASAERKLAEIKSIRLQKLEETDYMANSDYTMPDDVKTWRQTLRDIPTNYTTETQYDELLVRDNNSNLTHEVWSK